jgi:hypothetical protein
LRPARTKSAGSQETDSQCQREPPTGIEEVKSLATREEKQAYLDEMVRKRGYVLDYHKVLTNCDLDLMKASAALVEAAYLNERKLDRRTKD